MFRKKKEEKESPVSTVADKGVASLPAVDGTSNFPSPVARSESAEDVISRRFGKPRSALGPGTVIQGKLSFDTVVIIEGKLGGEVYSTETLIVGKQGSINAQVRVKNLVVAGVVTGNVVASDSIELLRGGRIDGDFSAKRLIIEEGAVFNGNCRMGGEASEAAAAQLMAAEKAAAAAVQGATALAAQLKVEQSKHGVTEKKSTGPSAGVSAPSAELAVTA